MKHLALVLTLFAAACSSDSSPIAPSAAPAAPLPAPTFTTGHADGSSCSGSTCSSFIFNITNTGPGCAVTLDLAGTLTFGPNKSTWELTIGSKIANDGIFAPGMTLQATGGPMTFNGEVGEVRFTKTTLIACKR